ncbi:MAG: aspartate aminotransferase family protein [Firmicutes bacterium]|nr:aspartate aminotransferase family protein [Bacillota bacterium]
MNNQQIMGLGQQYLMPTYNRLPIALVKGEGAYVYDADGNKYLDFVAGVAVNALGHCYPAVVQAVREQAEKLLHCSNLYWIEPQVKLAQMLVENSCFDKAFFCNSGAEANEAAIKLSRKYAKKNGFAQRYQILSMRNSFHGRTLATLTATGQDKCHAGFDPLPEGFAYAPFNDLAAVTAAVNDKTAAILLEPIQGEGGVLPAERQFLQGLRQLCDEKNILLIFDEVQVGCGRTGSLFAYQQFGVEPDAITLAKALAGGLAIGALLVKEKANVFVPGEHASTFGGNALATAAGCAAIGAMLEKDIPGQAKKTGAYFQKRLQELCDRFDSLQQVRGMGLLLGVCCDKPAAAVVAKCVEKGLLINCTAGTVLRFVPPLIIGEAEVDQCIDILEAALTECGF